MFALRLTINKREPVVAGAEDLSVLSATLSLVGRLGSATVNPGSGKPNMHVQLGGLTSRPGRRPDEHLRWLPFTHLRVGDRVVVEIIETDKVGRVVERSKARGKSNDERHFYPEIKKQYLKLKKKYEPES